MTANSWISQNKLTKGIAYLWHIFINNTKQNTNNLHLIEQYVLAFKLQQHVYWSYNDT